MFFMMGISEGRQDFEFGQMTICRACGRYGRLMVYMTYTVLSLFFIPCFKWNRQYFVKSSCCGRIYRLNPEVGRKIARGEQVEIRPEDMEDIGYSREENWSSSGWNKANWNVGGNASAGTQGYENYGNRKTEYENDYSQNPGYEKRCSACGYTTREDFDYCPKCGRKF